MLSLPRFQLISATVAAVMIAGCPAIPSPEPITRGMIAGRPIRIVGHGFELRTGLEFRPPFQSACYRTGTRFDTGRLDEDTAAAFDVGLAMGARVVRVHDETTRDELHGLLLLCNRMSTADMPHGDSYAITLPERLLSRLGEQRVGVAFERQYWSDVAANGLGYRWVRNHWFAWILWVSREPIFDVGGAG